MPFFGGAVSDLPPVKRPFSTYGSEIPFSSELQAIGAGCDIEIAEVTVCAVRAWTFAFAAFGPPETRRETLLTSWQALLDAAPCPEPFWPRTGRAMGYPEWLTLTVSSEPGETHG